MSFRTIVIDSRCKLEYSLNYLVCIKGLEQTKVLIDEITTILINSTQVSITTTLISECINKKIKILFTDDKHNISGEITPFQNNYYSSRKLKQQITFNDDVKGFLWQNILVEKIKNQARMLQFLELENEATTLFGYADNVEPHDKSNKEGVSAKIYFQSIFGKTFNRDKECDINKYLNYGYSIILSSFNRIIKSFGYFTELGIHHIGDSNPFNLSCDFMEPLRPLVDSYVCRNDVCNENFKDVYINMLSKKVKFNGRELFLENAIEEYVESLFSFLLTGDVDKIKFIEYEL